MKKRSRPILRGLVALLAFVALFVWIGGVTHLDFSRPFRYVGDALVYQASEAHGYIYNDLDTRLYAPFELDHEQWWHYPFNALFRSNSNLLWLVAPFAGGNDGLRYNLAYLAGFLLAFVSAYFVYARIGLRNPFRFGAASLYALMPYHFQRGEGHFWESCYYLTPLLALVLLFIWSARPLGHCGKLDGGWKADWRDKRLLPALILIVFFSSFNPYHQFFFACLAAGTAPLAAFYRRNTRPLTVGLALAALAMGVLVLKVLIAKLLVDHELILADINQPISGYGGAESYPLKLVQMVLPVPGHRWSALANIRSIYDASNPLNNENSTTTLGFIGSCGLLASLAFALLPQRTPRVDRLRKAGLIVLVAILFAMMGGLSSVISTASLIVFGPDFMLTEARGWNRIVVFIGFFAYFASFWLLQGGMAALRSRFPKTLSSARLDWPVFALLFSFALWDQVPRPISQDKAEHYASDQHFFSRVEATLPAGARIFQVPFVVHHASNFVAPGVYYTDALRPFVSTKTLHFTYGGDDGSLQTAWLRHSSALPVEKAVPRLCRYGFSGVLVQRNMIKDPAAVERNWATATKAEAQHSEDGDFAFFDLRPYCEVQKIAPLDLSAIKREIVARHGSDVRASHASELPE